MTMQLFSAWLVLAAILALAIAAAWPASRLRPARFPGGLAALLALGLGGLAGLCSLAFGGSAGSSEIAVLRFDGLSLLALVVLSVIAGAVYRYSLTYLAGEPGQMRFLQVMLGTIAATALFVLSDHLMLTGVLWGLLSYGMHRLLKHYGSRETARRAANKKFWLSRLGDACFWVAVLLLARGGASLRPSDWVTSGLGSEQPVQAALLLTAAVLLKSAQFPFHTWLPETMEAPTPVSALMHAGVVNAGGLLLLKCTNLLAAAPQAMDLALLVGGATAAVGCIVWWTQTNTKLGLAWSTVSQMGFLLVEIGLGLFTVALLHLLGHALYKAQAFLRSGTLPRAQKPASEARPTDWAVVAYGAVLAAGCALLAQWGGRAWESEAVLAALWVVVAVEATRHSAPRLAARLIAVSLLFGGFFLVHLGSHLLLGPWFAEVPNLTERGLLSQVIAVCVVLSLVAVSAWLRAPWAWHRHPFAQALHVHALNGFYLGTIASLVYWKLIGSMSQKERHV
jgi:NAD(P)H-quinone oxidoreductase subunit 5